MNLKFTRQKFTYLGSEVSFKLVTEEAADSWGFGSCFAKSFSSISLSLAAVSTGLAAPNIDDDDVVITELCASVLGASELLTVLGFNMSFGRSCGGKVVSPPAVVKNDAIKNMNYKNL